ncbi:MAG: PRA1 family protein [Chloroflexi bacterium]|nr:PRA1 family protein [Chloroflexota bacterium]
MTDDTFAATEKWFRRRGIPHFIEDYSARRDVLTKALPFLILTAVFEVTLVFNPAWAWWINVLLVAGACAALGATWAGINFLRGRPLRALPERVGAVELIVFLLAPSIVAAVFAGDWEVAPLFVVLNALILGIVYVTVSFALLPIMRWAGWLVIRNAASVVGLFARALPLLLLIVTFLFMNAELWSMAASLEGARFWLVMWLFALVTVVFVLFRLPAEIGQIERFASAERVADLVRGTPVEGLVLREDALDLDAPLRRGQRTNASIVVLFNLSLQVLSASMIVGAFFLVFGVLALGEGVIASWIQGDPRVLAELGWPRGAVVTEELLRVALFLAAFSGFYFTISVLTNREYRDEFFEDIVGEVRQACAVRVVYLGALAQRKAEGDAAQPG